MLNLSVGRDLDETDRSEEVREKSGSDSQIVHVESIPHDLESCNLPDSHRRARKPRNAISERVERVIFLSTRAVYGPKASGTALNEDTPATPDTLYGKVKRDAEEALLAMVDGDLAASVLRVTGVYGPAGPGRRHKWADLFDDFLAGMEIAPRAGTEVHGEDVAAAIRIALDRPTPAILNVSDLIVDRHDLLAIVRDATGSAHPLPGRADASAVNEMDCARLKSQGWTPGGRPLLERTVRALLG